MKKTKASTSRDQVLAPVIIVVIGVVIVGAIAYFGRSAKQSEPVAPTTGPTASPGATRPTAQRNDPNRPARNVAQDPPSDITIDIKDDHVKGDKKARLVFIEFSDYQ